MARARNIKPGFFTNDLLAEIEPLGRLLFQGLWCHADREGRLSDRPKKIKAEILPYDNADVDALLFSLVVNNFIIRYSVGGDRFIQVVNFTKHQNPHMKESASEIPAPDMHGASTVQAPDKNRTSPADPPFPFPSTPSKPLAQPTGSASLFSQFWQAYPKKRSKGDAEKAWKAIKPDEHLLGVILAAVQRARTREDWIKNGGEFIPYPASWLRAKGWEDETGIAAPLSIAPVVRICACCGDPASRSVGNIWYCTAHDQYSERTAA